MSFGQDGHMVRDFDKSEHDFLRRYGRTPEEVIAENAKLREYAKLMHDHIKECCDACGERGICDVDALMRKLGIEVPS